MTASSVGGIGSLAIFSMASILVLAAVVGVRSYQCMLDNGTPSAESMPAMSVSTLDAIASLPVFISCFLCHFNIVPVFAELRLPTRERAHNMVHITMVTTLILYLWVGLMGYAYSQCR